MGYRPPSARNAAIRKPSALVLLKWRLAVAVPAANDLSSLWGTVFDQGQSGSCTAQSTCKSLRLSLQAGAGMLPEMIGETGDFSPDDVYKTTRVIERSAMTPAGTGLPTLIDSGCEPDDCITAVAQCGVVPIAEKITSDGRYNDVEISKVNEEPNLNTLERAALSLYPGAYAVDLFSSDGGAQVQALNTKGVGQTLALFVDTQNVMGWDPNKGPITKIDLRDPQGGGHQVGISGYRTDPTLGLVIKFGNSWGDWGMDGFGEITWNCLMAGAADAIVAYDVALAVATGKAIA